MPSEPCACRLGLRQRDIALRAGVSQQHVSDFERGQLGRMQFDDVRSMLGVVDARLVVTAHLARRPAGSAPGRRACGDRHRGRASGSARDGWDVLPEVTYAIYGERGSIDILAWHPSTRTMLVVEVKTEITSVEELLRRHDAKVRLGPTIGRERFGTRASLGRPTPGRRGYRREPPARCATRWRPVAGLCAPRRSAHVPGCDGRAAPWAACCSWTLGFGRSRRRAAPARPDGGPDTARGGAEQACRDRPERGASPKYHSQR